MQDFFVVIFWTLEIRVVAVKLLHLYVYETPLIYCQETQGYKICLATGCKRENLVFGSHVLMSGPWSVPCQNVQQTWAVLMHEGHSDSICQHQTSLIELYEIIHDAVVFRGIGRVKTKE